MKFALAGNPNSGKTTLFNTLTGSTAKTGNWSGVTVESRVGQYKKLDHPIEIVDLPGIYSLSPYTDEETVARNYVLEENPNIIINIVDVNNLERNLYLTTQLLEMDCPVIVALNMMDVLESSGATIDIKSLEKELGVPVVAISALKSSGIDELMKEAVKTSKSGQVPTSIFSNSSIEKEFNQILELVSTRTESDIMFYGTKLLEEDILTEEKFPSLVDKVNEIKSNIRLDKTFNNNFETFVANERYSYIEKHFSKTIDYSKAVDENGLTTSDKIDEVLTHKFFGIPIFLGLMFLVFHLTFGEKLFYISEHVPSPGVWLQGLTETFIEFISGNVGNLLTKLDASDWISGLIIDGIISGVGSVLSFLPQVMLLFLFLSLMEDSGYMARVAFIMDRFLRKFGMSGKAFVPLLMGFGCSVPAIMGTRTLESKSEKRMAILLMPFFSCGAKLPIWAMFAAAFSPKNPDILITGIYVLGIVVAVIASLVLKKTAFKDDVGHFIIELPTYHMPTFRNTAMYLYEKTKGFLFRVSTIITASVIVIWFLSNFSFSLEMVESNGADSILGVLGNFLRPIFLPLGFASGSDGWKVIVAILTGLVAKEMVVSTLGVLYNPSVSGDALESSKAQTALIATLTSTFSLPAALSFITFNLLSVPCMAAVAAAKAELNSRKWIGIAIGFWISTAWIASFAV